MRSSMSVDSRQIIFDTETTGMNKDGGPIYMGHRLIEIGCVEMIERQLTGNTFHCYINPGMLIDKEAIAVHGITDTFLKDKPYFEDIVKPFLSFIQGAELIAHNAKFDVSFIDYELQRLGYLKTLKDMCTITDTLLLAREKKNKGELTGNLNLDALCKYYGIDNSSRTYHGALLDAQILADVYLFLTGGQKKLQFYVDINSKKIVNQKVSEKQNIKIIYANELELRQHHERLALMSEHFWDHDV